MNTSRLIASVGGYFLSASDDAIALHLYGGISATVTVAGCTAALRETSTYPWAGAIHIEVNPEAPVDFSLKLRIPGWARSAIATVNGAPVAAATTRGYLSIDRRWQPGDTVALDLAMPPERIYAHPAVAADAGRVLRRGPLVYCVEEADNAGAPVQRLRLHRDPRWTPMTSPPVPWARRSRQRRTSPAPPVAAPSSARSPTFPRRCASRGRAHGRRGRPIWF